MELESNGVGDGQMDWWGVCSNAAAVLVHCGEGGGEPEGEALNLPAHLRSNSHGHKLLVVTERTRSWIGAAQMSFLRRVAGLSLRDKVRSSDTQRDLGVEPLLLGVRLPDVWGPCLACFHRDAGPDKQKEMDGWMDGWNDRPHPCVLYMGISENVSIHPP